MTSSGIRFNVDDPSEYAPGQHLSIDVDGRRRPACVLKVDRTMVEVAWRTPGPGPCEWCRPPAPEVVHVP